MTVDKQPTKTATPENTNPQGPDRKYNGFEQLVYDTNFALNTKLLPAQQPLAQKINDSFVGALQLDAVKDAVRDAGVYNLEHAESAKGHTVKSVLPPVVGGKPR